MTFSLDDDVAVLLARVHEARKASLKQVVNEALRQGLRQMISLAPQREPYRTPEVSLGCCLMESIDNVSEVLAGAEGDSIGS